MQVASDHWQRIGGRMTVVREIICRIITGWDGAFLSDELWGEARKIDPGISQASVYRTLRDLVKGGLLREIHGPEKHRSFIRSHVTSPSQVTFVCMECHRAIPAEDESISRRLLAVIPEFGLMRDRFHLSIQGTCTEFRNSGLCETFTDCTCGNGKMPLPAK